MSLNWGHVKLEVLDGYLNGYDKQAIRHVEIQRLGVYTCELPTYEMDLSHASLHRVIKEYKWYFWSMSLLEERVIKITCDIFYFALAPYIFLGIIQIYRKGLRNKQERKQDSKDITELKEVK